MTYGRPEQVLQILGGQLRFLREARGVSREDAARHIGADPSKVSRIEGGKVRSKTDEFEQLLQFYEVPVAERSGMVDIMSRANAPQWWDRHSSVLTNWLCSYLVFESAAVSIRTYEVHFIPGLLQTAAYAEASIRLWHPNDAEVRRRVDVRAERRRMLLSERRVLWAVVDEAALRRQIGGAKVMREQLEFLVRASALPNVQIQILPVGSDAGVGNSFSILRLPTTHLLDVVYLEQMDSAQFFSERNRCDPYLAAMERICAAAREPAQTVKVIEQILREL